MSNGHTKILRFDERFPVTGEPTLQLISARSLNNVKLASEAADYVRAVQPVEGKTIVLVLAMSAGEYYGPNRNGDAFAERAVPGAVEENETLPKHYKTFESNAHVYRHHINKDPAKSMGKVLKAFYNWEMHRVELLLELDNQQAADIVSKIEAGEFPAVSMGCKIKYDVCSICGNKAPTRAQYCDHAKYEMNRVYADGQKSYVWNPSPQLFDISFVIRPADRIGFMMKKVAHEEPTESSYALGDKVAEIQEKVSTLKKLSDIDKIIRGDAVAATPQNRAVQSFRDAALPGLMAHTPSFDGEAINLLSSVPLAEALSTLGSMGITPTGIEITRIMVNRAMPGTQLPQHVEDNISAAQGPALDAMHQHPEILESLQNSGLLDLRPENVNQDLAQKLGHWMEKRSTLGEFIERRVFTEAHPDIGNWDTVKTTDPRSGESYTTTQGAIDQADDANSKHQLKILAGAGLLSGIGYKALSAIPSGRVFAPLVGAAGLVGGAAMAHHAKVPGMQAGPDTKRTADKLTGEQWNTVDVPINAEMRKSGADVASAVLPLASSAAVTAMLAQDYNRRSELGELGARPGMLNKAVEAGGRVASTSPRATFLAGLAGIGLGANALQSVGKYITKVSSDSVELPEVDLNGLVYSVGDRLFAFGRK